MIELFSGQPKLFEPGEKMEYSNTNYVLLSYIAEKIDGKEFSAILEERITRPLGLQKTRIGGRIDNSSNEAGSYVYSESWKPSTETDMSIPTGAGAIISTPSELNVFINALFEGKLLTVKSMEHMVDFKDRYGLGMMVFPFYEKKAYGHGGSIDGFETILCYFPDDNLSVAVAANGLRMNFNDLLIGILSICFNKEYQLPVYTEKIIIKPEELDRYTGVYASRAIPVKLTISKKGNALFGQGTGQPEFPLEAFDTHKFRFDQAGIIIEFIPADNKMILLQGGGRFEFTKE